MTDSSRPAPPVSPVPQWTDTSVVPHPSVVDEGTAEVSFECAALDDVLWEVLDVALSEALSSPYELRLVLRPDRQDIEPAVMLMSTCVVRVQRKDQEQRFTGIVADLVEGGTNSHALRVEVLITPALLMLAKRRDTRIFQAMTVPQILEAVLSADWLETYARTVRFQLDRADYPVCEYRVQYDETDLDFVHRLMQEEGIFYWFEHDGETEAMVLADHPSRHRVVDRPSGDAIRCTKFYSSSNNCEVIRQFFRRSRIVSTRQATRHHDWTRALSFVGALDGEAPAPGEPPHGATSRPVREEYDHDGRPVTFHDYRQDARGYRASDYEQQLQLRREHQARDARVGEGRSTVISFRPGRVFEMVGHRQPELDGAYVVTSVEHSFTGEHDDGSYVNHFHCLPVGVAFRPERRVPRPRIHGVQTAVVVGPSGEDVHTDEHGRVKVQFHWDRLGGSDEHSSCWVRVMQPWAGDGWGFSFIPRVGMEVTVTFVHGDPDRPLVTGAVYNGTHPLPSSLPEQKTRSVLKTRSTPGGGGYNELSFEDLAGHEEIAIRAQRDLSTYVGNNQKTDVRHDALSVVRGSQTNLVSRDQTERIDGSSERKVVGDSNEQVQGARIETVRGKSELSVGEDRLVEVGGAERREVTRTSTLIAGDDVTAKTTGNHATLIGTDEDKRSFVVYTHGSSELKSSEMTEIVSDTGLRLRCGESIVEIMPDSIQLVSPWIHLRAPDARVEVTGDRVYAHAERRVEMKSDAVVLEGAVAGIKLRTEVQVDGDKILLNSPTNAADPVEEIPVPLTLIELCDDDGAPIPYERFVLVFEDGSERTGFLDEQGKAEVHLERPATVRFPGLLEAAKS